MNIIVCLKQVMDPDVPSIGLQIDTNSNKVVQLIGQPPILDPYSEHALEAALRIKDARGGKVTALSLGTDLLSFVVKKPLSIGADELILLEDKAFADGDSWSTAYALAMAIKNIGSYDLILCGLQDTDWNAEQVGPGIAEFLGLPSVTAARKIDITDDKARVERVTDDGYEVIETSLPALITVSDELGEVRNTTIKGIMAAKGKEPIVWQPADIGVLPSEVGAAGRRSNLVKLSPPFQRGKCEIIEGGTPEEAGANLALKLRQARLL